VVKDDVQMAKRISDDVRKECLRLRVEERLSIREIGSRLNIGQGTIHALVKDNPLTRDESREKRSRTKGGRKTLGERSKFFDLFERSGLKPMQKANAAEAAILFRLCLHGFNVFGPPFDSGREDWVVISPKTGNVSKIQVKLVHRHKAGLPMIRLKHNHGPSRYQKGEFDFIVGYDPYVDEAYVFSFEETAMKNVSVSVTAESAEAWHKIL
jgi:hypothetical protein